MKPGRPKDGFRIKLSPEVEAMVADVLDSYPDAEWRWDAVLARLRATGHVAGTSMGKHGAERADTFVLDNWRVVLAWRVENGTILVKRAMF